MATGWKLEIDDITGRTKNCCFYCQFSPMLGLGGHCPFNYMGGDSKHDQGVVQAAMTTINYLVGAGRLRLVSATILMQCSQFTPASQQQIKKAHAKLKAQGVKIPANN